MTPVSTPFETEIPPFPVTPEPVHPTAKKKLKVLLDRMRSERDVKERAASALRENWYLFLAREACNLCESTGIMRGQGSGEPSEVCHCVYRKIYREVIRRYIEAASCDPFANRVRLTACNMGISASRPAGEFICDVWKVGRAALIRPYWRIFEEHMLKHVSFRELLDVEGLNKGEFFHLVVRMEKTLGKAFLENGIFPMDQYFSADPERPTITTSNLRSSRSSTSGSMEYWRMADRAVRDTEIWGRA